MKDAAQRPPNPLTRAFGGRRKMCIRDRGCAALVSPQLLERYAMSVARWIQCEEAITE